MSATDASAILLDASRRAALAEERQLLWKKLGQTRGWSDPRHRPLTIRVRRITAELNGHDADLVYGTAGARAGSGGGLYERKRHDRAALETRLGIHEFFLDSAGRKVRAA